MALRRGHTQAAFSWLSPFHCQGSNSGSRLCGVSAMRASTSATAVWLSAPDGGKAASRWGQFSKPIGGQSSTPVDIGTASRWNSLRCRYIAGLSG